MRRRSILIAALALAVVVATIGATVYALHNRAQADAAFYPGLHGPVSVMCPGLPDPLARDGHLPVIRPRNDCTPSFTQQDVRDDLAHGVRLVYFEAVGPLTVLRVVFLTSGDLKGIGGPIDTSADTRLCYAELSGMFRDGTQRVPLGTTTTASAAFIVFDAHTGKALVLGLGPGPLRG